MNTDSLVSHSRSSEGFTAARSRSRKNIAMAAGKAISSRFTFTEKSSLSQQNPACNGRVNKLCVEWCTKQFSAASNLMLLR